LLARHFEIDLAIDMKGYTTHCRPGIFAYRAAPVQINYLGFPGTMGAPYIDYLIADAEIIPPNADHHYSEKILRLPGCYQVNDEFRTKTGRTFTRAMLGLPEDAFVFCSFNNNYKIDPKIFDIWCRLLNRVPDSVLWIMADNKLAMENLKAEATKRGVAEGKLIFTPRCSLADHISRQEHGDLLLDTFPCNAHTTASDALFAGLPLLTLRGETFSSRVAASILKAVGLDDFITDTYESYEEKAFQLAHERGRLQAIKQALRTHIKSSDLYNTTRFTKNYEECLMRIYQESQQA
jgi:predicted O-linked N-acetylglucosamine transferase (SPINDLY family)